MPMDSGIFSALVGAIVGGAIAVFGGVVTFALQVWTARRAIAGVEKAAAKAVYMELSGNVIKLVATPLEIRPLSTHAWEQAQTIIAGPFSHDEHTAIAQAYRQIEDFEALRTALAGRKDRIVPLQDTARSTIYACRVARETLRRFAYPEAPSDIITPDAPSRQDQHRAADTDVPRRSGREDDAGPET